MKLLCLLLAFLCSYSFSANELLPGQERTLNESDIKELKKLIFKFEKPILINGTKFLYDEVYIDLKAIFAPDQSSYGICKSKAVRALILESKLGDPDYVESILKNEFQLIYLSLNEQGCSAIKMSNGIALHTPIAEPLLYTIVSRQERLFELAIELAKESNFPPTVFDELKNGASGISSIELSKELVTNNFNYLVNFDQGLSLTFQIENDNFQAKEIGLNI